MGEMKFPEMKIGDQALPGKPLPERIHVIPSPAPTLPLALPKASPPSIPPKKAPLPPPIRPRGLTRD